MEPSMAVVHPFNYFISGIASQIMPIFAILILLALILFVVWMSKFAQKEELKKWILWFLAIGFIGWILCIFLIVFDQHRGERSMMNAGGKTTQIQYPEQMMDGEFVPEMMDFEDEN